MKKILAIVSVLFVVLASSLTGCTTSAPAQDVPQYGADQVIYIVQAKYPTCDRRVSGQTLQAGTRITATYVGSKVWKATAMCPTGYNYNGLGGVVVYFYEADGSLWGGYNSTTKTLSSPR